MDREAFSFFHSWQWYNIHNFRFWCHRLLDNDTPWGASPTSLPLDPPHSRSTGHTVWGEGTSLWILAYTLAAMLTHWRGSNVWSLAFWRWGHLVGASEGGDRWYLKDTIIVLVQTMYSYYCMFNLFVLTQTRSHYYMFFVLIAARRTVLLYTYKFKCWCMGLTLRVVIQNFRLTVH
jgi:hypothetical protein